MRGKITRFQIQKEQPILSTAIHAGHRVRKSVQPYMKLNEQQRLREEDPYTNIYTRLPGSRLVVNRSRFELDVNRREEKSIYLNPEDAWGLDVYKKPVPEQVINKTHQRYHQFYRNIIDVIEYIKNEQGLVMILDIHSYNHRRKGPAAPPADPELNPDINIGTDDMNRDLWDPVIDSMKYNFKRFEYSGKKYNVKENLKFRGGHFPHSLHHYFNNKVCVISIEFKKEFMDEWTGEPYPEKIKANLNLLQETVPVIKEQSQKVLKNLY